MTQNLNCLVLILLLLRTLKITIALVGYSSMLFKYFLLAAMTFQIAHCFIFILFLERFVNMHSLSSRLNALFAFFLSVMGAVAFGCFASTFYKNYNLDGVNIQKHDITLLVLNVTS